MVISHCHYEEICCLWLVQIQVGSRYFQHFAATQRGCCHNIEEEDKRLPQINDHADAGNFAVNACGHFDVLFPR
jgi:hypothetical protein